MHLFSCLRQQNDSSKLDFGAPPLTNDKEPWTNDIISILNKNYLRRHAKNIIRNKLVSLMEDCGMHAFMSVKMC